MWCSKSVDTMSFTSFPNYPRWRAIGPVSYTHLDVYKRQSVVGALPVAPSSALVVQNGAGNYVPTQVVQNPTATVIQNTLDNQKIQSVTTINASVNSIQMTRAMSVQNAIQYGIVSSLRR